MKRKAQARKLRRLTRRPEFHMRALDLKDETAKKEHDAYLELANA